jgi:hypothetical protein
MSKITTGLSGCKIEILEGGGLRKTSASKEYNSRLSSQIDKQKHFSHFILKNIETPNIININKINLYYFDMEYVSGLSFDSYLSSATKKDLDFIIDTLYGYFDFLAENSKEYSHKESKDKIIHKLETLKSTTTYQKYIDYLINFIENLNLKVPKSFCHGDLTFSNILFHPNRLYFIDFLDTFIDTFLLDLIKLKQDLYHNWNLKTQEIEDLRVKQAYRYIWNNIEKKYYDFIHTKEFKILDILNSLRIAPYTKTPKHKIIIHDIIQSDDTYKKFIDSNGREII